MKMPSIKTGKEAKLTNTLAVYLAMALVAAFVMIFVVIRPVYSNASQTKAKVEEKVREIKALEQLARDTETLRTNYEDVKDERDKILALLPVDSEEERLLAMLSKIAEESGVVLSSFAPDQLVAAAEGVTSINVYPATVTATGLYPSVKLFLEKIEDGARFVDIESGAISGTSTSVVSARLKLNAYYQATKPAGGGQSATPDPS